MTSNLSYLEIFLILMIAGLLSLFYWQRNKYLRQISSIQNQLSNLRQSVNLANERLDSVFHISHRFVQADDEENIVKDLVELAIEATGAIGVSFVPLDNHGQPLAAARRGDFPFPVPDAWLEYLASPRVRSECTVCTNHDTIVKNCPLLKGPFSEVPGLYCLPLQRGEIEYGILNIYLPDNSKLDFNTRAFLRSLVDATALAIEGVRLRRIEHEMINHLRAVQQQANYRNIIQEILDKSRESLQADFGWLYIHESIKNDQEFCTLDEHLMTSGQVPTRLTRRLGRIAQNIFKTNTEILDVITPDNTETSYHAVNIIGMPIFTRENIPVGVILLGNKGDPFEKTDLRSLESMAFQLGLVLQTSKDIAEITYKSMMDERVRLSREIHDGLAQTLGFLKLLVAQMQSHIQQGDLDRVKNITRTCYKTLTDAYIDAREAIDGLRVFPVDESGRPSTDIDIWLQQTVSEFQENQEFQTINIDLDTEAYKAFIPPEVQAQLIRIVQESLSNVRKHSKADRAEIVFIENKGDLIMEIRDNGLGFSPGEIPGASRHGLKGMRERTELIGADFQVISFQGEGTKIRVRIPSPTMDKWKKVYETYSDSGH